MRIAFLITRFEKPSARYRVIEYLPYFQKAGWEVSVFAFGRRRLDRIKIFWHLSNFDVVFLQKRLFGLLDWGLLRWKSRFLAFDFDDAIMFHDSSRKKNIFSLKGKIRFGRTISNSDIVFAGNPYLCDLAKKHNQNVLILPTAIDMELYTPKKQQNPSLVTLGWIGSSPTLFHMERMIPVWNTVHKKYPHTQLKIVSDHFFDCGIMPVIKKPWTFEEVVDCLQSFDIGIMPLPDDNWTKGKCGFKLLQYMAVGLPVVCSPVGVNREIVIDRENGFWANNVDEWLDRLGILIESPELRNRMGEIGRKIVLKKYALKDHAAYLISVLDKMVAESTNRSILIQNKNIRD
jgi:glycosyltransferase involved in cell wall biosynthesis